MKLKETIKMEKKLQKFIESARFMAERISVVILLKELRKLNIKTVIHAVSNMLTLKM